MGNLKKHSAITLNPTPPGKKPLDYRAAVKLALQGLTDAQIGRALNTNRKTIHGALRDFRKILKDPSQIHAFNDNYVNVLNTVLMDMVPQLTDPEKLKAASLNNVAYAFDKVNNAVRLATGQSTSNFSHVVHDERASELSKLQDEIRDIEAELEGTPEPQDIVHGDADNDM